MTIRKNRTRTPLRALWQHTLGDVVPHSSKTRTLTLSADQQHDLVEYLKSR